MSGESLSEKVAAYQALKVMLDEAKQKRKRSGIEIIAAILVTIPLFAISAWTIELAWAWFVRPVFASAPEIGFKAALCISLAKSTIMPSWPSDADVDKSTAELIVQQFIRAGILLGIAAIAHLIVGTP